MINDMFVFNAVSHAYNMTDANTAKNHYAKVVRDQLCGMHLAWQPPGVGMSVREQCTDWPMEIVAKALFLESDCDMAATHTLRLDSYFKDGLCARKKTVEAIKRWPQRFVSYVGVDPTLGLETCLREFDEQMDELPNSVGLKMYPAQVDPIRSWRMDDPKLAFPLFKHAQDRGIKVIAIHKAAPLGPVPFNPFRIDDINGAADEFPDLSFEIIHAGFAFMDETLMATGLYPNIYANLEGTSSFANRSPGSFEEMMAQFMLWGGASKILYSDGTMVFHSQPILEKFRDFQFSEQALYKYGIPQITKDDMALILGGNFARITGIDVEKAKKAIENDEFAQERRKTGLQAPYSNWRNHLATHGLEYAA